MGDLLWVVECLYDDGTWRPEVACLTRDSARNDKALIKDQGFKARVRRYVAAGGAV